MLQFANMVKTYVRQLTADIEYCTLKLAIDMSNQNNIFPGNKPRKQTVIQFLVVYIVYCLNHVYTAIW